MLNHHFGFCKDGLGISINDPITTNRKHRYINRLISNTLSMQFAPRHVIEFQPSILNGCRKRDIEMSIIGIGINRHFNAIGLLSQWAFFFQHIILLNTSRVTATDSVANIVVTEPNRGTLPVKQEYDTRKNQRQQ
ncbi:MAG: hypothetical protein RIS64_2707 [Bacteroidota bacterium]